MLYFYSSKCFLCHIKVVFCISYKGCSPFYNLHFWRFQTLDCIRICDLPGCGFLYAVLYHHYHHHVPEVLGVLSCSLILKMKLVPPPLPWSSRVPLSVWSIVMLVLVVYLCPSCVCVVATFSGIVLFPLLYSVLLFFP